jgi:hypothetical protein
MLSHETSFKLRVFMNCLILSANCCHRRYKCEPVFSFSRWKLSKLLTPQKIADRYPCLDASVRPDMSQCLICATSVNL